VQYPLALSLRGAMVMSEVPVIRCWHSS